ncbi:MAG TPA: ATP-binding cassette domain-containing protein [Acidimicrobiia bacterium]|nr:ATP-binding cassette domain-containing protein [Acidimicrobiia bacterium]
MTAPVIEAEGLTKRYGETQALAGIDLQVDKGTLLGVLGPNGAGKSTAVRILTTLARPDSGGARVAGFDVVHQAAEVRQRIGVTAQDATVDVALTGRQNLMMIGELSWLTRADAKARAAELLDQFDLTPAADRIVKGYSGGMRRRLDLAASLVTNPPILFLDEPTTGLDPASRAAMWDVIRGLLDDGVSVLLTTQYLDEADQLAHRIAVIDHGRVIADGTPAELKARTGRQRVDVRLSQPAVGAVEALATLVTAPPIVGDDGRTLSLAVDEEPGLGSRVVEALGANGIRVDEVSVHRPSLDDVFFHLTGHAAEDDDAGEAA